jgi:hypothetical protein
MISGGTAAGTREKFSPQTFPLLVLPLTDVPVEQLVEAVIKFARATVMVYCEADGIAARA